MTHANTKELRVAVIGAGGIARGEHLPAWRDIPHARVVAIADPSGESLMAAGDRFSIERRVRDYRHLLDDRRIDVIDICAPSALHAEMTIAALESGKHVLCEKPMTTSQREATAVLEAQRRAAGKLMIAQHLRFHPATLALRSCMRRFPLGEVYYARAHWLRRRRLPATPSFTCKKLSGGGALFDLGVHMLDLAWWMMGCPEPVSASGTISDRLSRRTDLGGEWGTWNPNRVEVEDFAAGWIRFAGGAVLSLETSWLGFQAQPEVRRIELHGDAAGASWPDACMFGETRKRPWSIYLAPSTTQKAHRKVVDEFAAAVLEDRPVPVPTVQCAAVIGMLEAVYRSAADRREVPIEPMKNEAGNSSR